MMQNDGRGAITSILEMSGAARIGFVVSVAVMKKTNQYERFVNRPEMNGESDCVWSGDDVKVIDMSPSCLYG
jgi:hypothetical protein